VGGCLRRDVNCRASLFSFTYITDGVLFEHRTKAACVATSISVPHLNYLSEIVLWLVAGIQPEIPQADQLVAPRFQKQEKREAT
jgi:hypothetical protein